MRSTSTSLVTGETLGGVPHATVRTRGPVVERVQLPASDQTTAPLNVLSLAALFKKIREDVGGFPLTIVVHGWPDSSAEKFRFLLLPLLIKGDALWFVPSYDRRVLRAPPAKEGAVILDLNTEPDSGIYKNLVGDIVFFPAVEEAEVSFAAEFQGRARAIVVDYRDTDAHRVSTTKSLVEAALGARLNIYLWLGRQLLMECAAMTDLDSTPDSIDAIADAGDEFISEGAESSLVQIGGTLKDLSDHLSDEFDRRFIFRSYLEQILEAYPQRPTWDRDLIMLAHDYQWPAWAIESLPKFYVVEKGATERDRALVWASILDCVPENYTRLGELCNGEFVEIEMSAEVRRFIEMVVHTFEEHLRRLPYASNSAFNGAINEALIEMSLQVEDPAAAEKIEQARSRVLDKIFGRS
jgi:hypothetical protein